MKGEVKGKMNGGLRKKGPLRINGAVLLVSRLTSNSLSATSRGKVSDCA